MTSQPGLQRITVHILHNISRSKENQTSKFCQVKESNKRNIFIQKSCRRPIFVFLKSFILDKCKWSAA